MTHYSKRISSSLFVGDVSIFVVSLFVTLLLRYQSIPDGELLSEHYGPFALLFVLWSLVFLISGLYDQYTSFDRKRLPGLIIKVQAINILLAALVFFSLPFAIDPKTNLLIYLLVSTLFIVVWRLFVYPKIQPQLSLKALLIGTGKEIDSVRKVLKNSPYFKQIKIEFIDTAVYNDTKVLQENMEDYVKSNHLDLVIADLNDDTMKSLAPLFFKLTFLDDYKVRFFTISEFYEKIHNRLPPSVIEETWLLQHLSQDTPHYAYDLAKRVTDFVGALVLLLPCIFIFPVVIAIIKYTDGGAIFYRTERVGLNNRLVTILKFRTMTGMDTGNEGLSSDLQVTPFGAFMRKLRIDELPQLINVLKGELSFIGPRPEMPALVKVYEEQIPYYNLRHSIKPGLSGWAQINNLDAPRKGVDVDRTIEKLSYDLYYLRHRSVLLDMEIALKTINTVLSRTGT